MRARITLADVTFGNKLVIEALAARNPDCNSLSVRRCCARGRHSESARAGRYAILLVELLSGSDRQIMPRSRAAACGRRCVVQVSGGLAAPRSTEHADSDRETSRRSMRTATRRLTRSPGVPDPVAEPFGHPMPVAAAHQP
jgi:hypothetical protein